MPIADRYDLEDCLHDSRSVSVHRARDRQDGAAVILKVQKPGAASRPRLRHEHAILERLAVPGVVQARRLDEQDGALVLVLDDHGGETLTARLARGRLPLAGALRVGAELATTLGRIHERRVIHKDINPSNLLLDRGGRAWVFDFDIATLLSREIQGVLTPNQLAGTLPYLSPEQTGRMNRAVDDRADLYALGVTLYEMLTGRVPFSGRDPLELIHAHIARLAAPPAEVDASIPGPVSAIVMKLLAKTAEDRYQSAFGLAADLRECQERLARTGDIAPFALGARDVSERFQIPQKLYGRDREIAAVEAAFARVQEGRPELFLVSGSSGIGKSSVVHELYKPLSKSRGTFVSGKFDQLQRDIPYSALLQALTELVRGLLAEPDHVLAVFRERLLAALSGAGRVLTDVLPDLTRALGPQPPVAELTGAEARNRFRFLFASFLQVFTRHGEPLVLFLDDLQWADAATLDLLASVLGDAQAGALLVIGACRDNEVGEGHPLRGALAAIEEAGCRVTRVAIGPIGVEQMRSLVEDTLALPASEAQPLAELLWRRAGGNPLFAGQMLTMLHKSGLLAFDPGRRAWTFDLAQIARAPSTESVAELLAARAAALDPRTQEVLRLAAVLGSRFDLDTLAIVAERSRDEARELLEEALREGLVVSLGQGGRDGYRFLHDRVQQAVYSALPEEARLAVHHRAGELLWHSPPQEDEDGWRFQVLHHLNLASDHVRDPGERMALSRLNQTAAERARAAAAFAAAESHYAAGIRLLPEGAWASHHALMFALHLGKAESAFMSGEHGEAERLFSLLLRSATSDAQRVQTYELMCLYQRQLGRNREAVGVAQEALALLGIELSSEPRAPRVLFEVVKTRHAMRRWSPDELLGLPDATDPRALAAMRMLAVVSPAAFITSPLLAVRFSLRMVELTLAYGTSTHSALGFSSYASSLVVMFGELAEAEALGRFAIALAGRHGSQRAVVETMTLYGTGLCFWRRPLREAAHHLEEAARLGLLSGSLSYASYALNRSLACALSRGAPLAALRRMCQEHQGTFERTLTHSTAHSIRFYEHIALALEGRTRVVGSLSSDVFDEHRYEEELRPRDTKLLLHVYWTRKIMVLFLLERHEQALELSALARREADRVLVPLMDIVDYHTYDALLLASLLGSKGSLARQRDLLLIRGHLRRLAKWAENAPMNFRHKHLLVKAELARVTLDDRTAMASYEEAIRLARDNEFLHDEAIALECAGKFYRARGFHDFAIAYLARARQAYARWGAHAKVALLDQAYPGLAARAAGDEHKERGATVTFTSSSTSTSAFDMPSMIKASQALSGEVALEKLLLRLMTVVAESAGAERGALVLPHGGALAVVAEFTAQRGATLPERPAPLGSAPGVSSAIVHYVVRAHERVLLADATTEGAFTADAHVTARKPRAIAAIPLLHQGQVTGVLYLENNLVPGAFTPERAELLEVLCAQMAISIDNARLYENLERKVAERTRALEEAQARLVQIEKEATEVQMAGGFAHEMRNALAGARLSLAAIRPETGDGQGLSACVENNQLLTELFLGLREQLGAEPLARAATLLRRVNHNEKRIDNVLHNIDRALTRGLGITGRILEYAEIRRAQPGNEAIALGALVASALAELEGAPIATTVQIPEECTLIGARSHIEAMIKHLVRNARDALLEVEDQEARALVIQAAAEPGRVVLSVRDTGPGIAPELHETIFEPFFSTKPATGAGLGLGMVRKLASLYGGWVELESAPGRGATFRLVLPRPEAAALRA